MEELERKYWFTNTQSFGQAITTVYVGAVSFIVMKEWRSKRNNNRLCFDDLANEDKFEFMRDVILKSKELDIFKNKRREKHFEIKDALQEFGFDMEDYI
ncbi:hypothetical protein LCGC14_3043870 [marine sediment metagenome]|uniref:Uncharacterized protein n=1 Tax=marine sediment metagenome TaxID=412755 RepID=A0A0F8XC23_9ZZZZ